MKRCPTCGEVKNTSEFHKRKKASDGCRVQCIMCERKASKAYSKTEKGVLTCICAGQRSSSTLRDLPKPSYTKKELKTWLYSQGTFKELFDAWVSSGYDKCKKPSVDRIDDYKGYSLDNIQLMTWGENKLKGERDRLNGVNNKLSKAVVAINIVTLKEVTFYSMREAARVLGITDKHIGSVCKGKRAHHKGFYWRYASSEEIKAHNTEVKSNRASGGLYEDKHL
jgi:hypothetical protein